MRSLLLSGLLVAVSSVCLPQEIPPRPEDLHFGELHFDVPDASRYRHELPNGVVVYVVEDHTFPLVNIGISMRQGSYLESPDKVGLASLTGSLLRTGGTADLAPEAFDEQAEFLAASLSSSGGDSQSGASLRCITPVLDDALSLWFDMMQHPRFDEGRLQIEKENLLEAMRQRNDDAQDILHREWSWLLYGEDYYASRRMTKANLDGISRADLVDFHRKYWRPENAVLSVSGDVEAESILQKLEAYLQGWPGEGADNHWPPPEPRHQPVPGVYHVEKDIPQGKVVLGHLVPQWTDWKNPERAAIQVMDHILGGPGFTSRLMQRIRSDEGLAYGAYSDFGFDPLAPSSFTIAFDSKSETVALAAKIALEEMRRIQNEPVGPEELEVAKASLVETFPRRFESARQIAGIYAYDALIGRSHEYWQNWREQVRAVTSEDVLRVARKYLKPDQILFLVVGKWDAIQKGDPEGRASMTDVFEGKVTHLPLRDPLTLK